MRKREKERDRERERERERPCPMSLRGYAVLKARLLRVQRTSPQTTVEPLPHSLFCLTMAAGMAFLCF
jgi:hypothetical protein